KAKPSRLCLLYQNKVLHHSLTPPVPAPLSVTVGQSVTLPCYAHIYRQKSQDAISLQWKKGQQDVLQMKSGKVTYGSEQRNRSSVSLDRIRQGDLSLTVQSVRLADEGVYSCSYELNDHPEDGDPARVTVAGHTGTCVTPLTACSFSL
uniref:Ig-like domain-containing protein n=1 Tax=Paramormyrops kingsleyae TaxID=1676925 RepID=A0A3B3Q4L0_9TELE